MQTIKVDLTNILGLTNQEILMRARADLRLGIPIVLTDKGNEAVIAPIDVLSQARLDQLKSIDENSFILITARRAQTLKCPVYDGNFARIQIGNAPKISILKAISDPSLDLRNPLKGPFEIIRGKPLRLENEVLLLLKSAQLLPAAIISRIKNGENVGHYWLEGKLKRELLDMTDITEEDFKKYLDPAAQTQYVRPYNNGEK